MDNPETLNNLHKTHNEDQQNKTKPTTQKSQKTNLNPHQTPWVNSIPTKHLGLTQPPPNTLG
jgi:hypothetical protein